LMSAVDSIWAELQAGEVSARKRSYEQKLTQRTMLPKFNERQGGPDSPLWLWLALALALQAEDQLGMVNEVLVGVGAVV